MEPEGSLPCSHKPATGPSPEPVEYSSPHRYLPKVDLHAKESFQVWGALKHFATIKKGLWWGIY
jgi:hypothetical protein